MPQKKKTIFLFIYLLCFLNQGPSSSYAQTSEIKASGDRLVVSGFQNLAPISPILTGTTLSSKLIDAIYDGLIQLDEQLAPKPHLAKSWTRSKDGLIWTFFIREGIKFHNGQELTAEDVAFTFEVIKNQQGGQPWSYVFKEIEQIKVLNPYTIQVTIKKPLAAFLQTLFVSILPKHILEGKDFTQYFSTEEVVGTGPYKLNSWSEKNATLVAFEEYFLGKPYLDEIHVDIYPNQEAVWAKVMAEEVDYFQYFTPKTFKILQQVPTFKLSAIPKPYYYLIAFNQNVPIFRDRKVRQALNYAINKEYIITKSLDNRGKVARGTIFPDSWAYNPKISPYSYDPQKALKLLNEAGWKDNDGDHLLDREGKPFQFSIHVNTGDNLKKQAILLIQQQLLDIGIQFEPIFFDAADMGFFFTKHFQTVFVELLSLPDPDMSYFFWHSSQINGGFNAFSFHNPEIDLLLDAGRTELDLNKRKEIYFKYQDEMALDPPGIFLFWTDLLVGIHQRFKGVKFLPYRNFNNIREWYVPKDKQRFTKTIN